MTEGEAPLFILSFRQRDELAALAAGAGWRVVAARRPEGVERRFLASGAAVAVVDARGAVEEGLAAVAALSPVVAANGGALLVLVSRGDTARLGAFLDAGATHFVVSPMRELELAHALRFAARHVERVTGGWKARGGTSAEPLGWRYDPTLRSLQLTPDLAALLDLPETPSVRALMRRIDKADRRLGRAALARLREGTPSTAFAHDLRGAGRVVHHLQRDSRTGRLHALIEPLGSAPDASATLREALTGVRDAASARRWLDRRLASGEALAVLLVGLTRFAAVNASHGRAAGDALLRAVSRRVEEAVRELLGRQALVARMGGPEFLVAAPEVDADRLELARGRLEEALARPFVAGDRVAELGVRIAMVRSVPGEDAAALLRRASEQLIGPVPASDDGPLAALAGELPEAMAAGQIEIRFQPQVSVSTRAIVGVEALARWRHPRLGEVGAETLFAAAERAELAVALSEHVQRLALERAASWPPSLAGLRLSINVTAEDVARASFADRFLDRVDASGFPRRRLTAEITESGLIAELSEAARLLGELRAAGVRVAIDDFGTGYSSLAYLKALPLDYLKIDQRLSQDITGSARDRVVVRGVIDMARSLGLAVIAEGVETEAQLDLLAKEGCQYFQGFLCAGPLTQEELIALVEKP